MCGISIEKACLAVQTTCKTLYNNSYYLKCQEQEATEPATDTLSDLVVDETGEIPEKYEPVRKQICNEKSFKNSSKEYQKYSFVLPSQKLLTTSFCKLPKKSEMLLLPCMVNPLKRL